MTSARHIGESKWNTVHSEYNMVTVKCKCFLSCNIVKIVADDTYIGGIILKKHKWKTLCTVM